RRRVVGGGGGVSRREQAGRGQHQPDGSPHVRHLLGLGRVPSPLKHTSRKTRMPFPAALICKSGICDLWLSRTDLGGLPISARPDGRSPSPPHHPRGLGRGARRPRGPAAGPPVPGDRHMSTRTIIIGVLALVFGGSAAVGVNLLYKGQEPPAETVSIVVAARD